jgi:hypothetical protein
MTEKSLTRFMSKAAAAFVLIFTIVNHGKELYVAPSGTSLASGSKENPLDLATALSKRSPAQPGDTIFLRGGKYPGKFTSVLNGAANLPITVRSHPGEWAILDSGESTNRSVILMLQGSWTIFRDFEVTSSDTKRQTSFTGPYPDDIKRGEGVHVKGPHTKVINLVVHDAALGIGAWSEAPDSEIYGCLIYYNGWQAPDRTHGHGIYSQNQDGTRVIRDNIIFSQFEKGIQVYGSDSAYLRNHEIEGNIVFNNGLISNSQSGTENLVLYGGTDGPQGIIIRDNFFYGSRFEGKLVVGGEAAKDLIFQNNYVPHLSRIRYWQSAVVTGNTFMRDSTMMECYMDSRFLPSNYQWNGNQYYCQQKAYSPFNVFRASETGAVQGIGCSFSSWQQQTGFDSSSSYTFGRPSGLKVVVRPNAYQAGRATIANYNWDQLPAVNVSLSSVLTVGQPYEIRNAQNFFGAPVVSGIFTGGPVSLPMADLVVAQPIGVSPGLATAPEFNAFILLAGPAPVANPVDSPPTVSSLENQVIDENSMAGPLPFTISDAETPPDQLAILMSSSNPTLVPTRNVRSSGSGANRNLYIIPAQNQVGSATISVGVTDGKTLVTKSIAVTVKALNSTPEISSISDIVTYGGLRTAALHFTVGDSETPAEDLIVTARSTDPSRVPDENIILDGTGENRTITVTPSGYQYGSTTIYVTVSDGHKISETMFNVMNAYPFWANEPPLMTTIRNQTSYGFQTATIPFVVDDFETGPDNLIITASSSNPTVVPASNISFGGSEYDRTITVHPAPGQIGSTTIYVTVSDGLLSLTSSFVFNSMP